MQHMLKKRRKWFFVHSDFGASCVNLWYYTEKRCWTFIFLPLGENHISDKSIILPACHMVIWNSASTTWTYTINQKPVRKKRCLIPMWAFRALGEVVEVHPELKRMMNAVFLSLLGDIIMMRHINLYYHSTSKSRTSKGNRNITLSEHIYLHSPAYSFSAARNLFPHWSRVCDYLPFVGPCEYD